MAEHYLSRILLRSRSVTTASGVRTLNLAYYEWRNLYSTTTTTDETLTEAENEKNKKGKWLTLPPFTYTLDGAALGKDISGRCTGQKGESTAYGTVTNATTALKWVTRCCPQLPRSLVQKLFRLRQVRREPANISSCDHGVHARVRRVSAKDTMELGDRIFLPITVQELPSEKAECLCNAEELKFLHSLELYKDSAIIVVNKPPGLPVQGGIGIKRSLDELARTYLKHDYSEPPRLVHRLDRDSSGILVMGRTHLSATVLHSIFREKTFGTSNGDLGSKKRYFQRRYWALVIGSPRRPEGLISMPLGKVVVDNGKSERITVIENVERMPSQHAVTKYRVIDSSSQERISSIDQFRVCLNWSIGKSLERFESGYTWLELSPLTGRKHQLRVHCAEVLGTPIVGDNKYGWQAHRKLKQLSCPNLEGYPKEKLPKGKGPPPFDLDLENGSVFEKQPYLHLHCKEMDLPDVSSALERASQRQSECDLNGIKSLKLVAPLPFHMQRSWDILHS
ncbi:hypothetical protein LguiA_008650 [Lonicera macranthoides]